jgi:hypothetical protein
LVWLAYSPHERRLQITLQSLRLSPMILKRQEDAYS